MAQGIINKRGGGGVSLPGTILVGETPIIIKPDLVLKSCTPDYTNVGSGYAFQVQKSCSCRIRYTGDLPNNFGSNFYYRLLKNGYEVIPGSEMEFPGPYANATFAKLDVSLNAGDTMYLQFRGIGTSYSVRCRLFMVSILAGDIQAELNKVIIEI